MKCPQAIKKGDKVALVSLSSGMAGDAPFYHRYEQGKKRLEEVFGLQVMTMPNALKGSAYLADHPEARAEDMMQAFADKSIKAVFCMIGGEDSIRLLPYIDMDVLKNNPKIFMGYSDTTSNHFMMYAAGVTSFYGPAVLPEFAENVAMDDYIVNMVHSVLFRAESPLEIPASNTWTSEMLDWADEDNNNIPRKMLLNTGYELLQGSGVVQGRLLGGCIEVFPMLFGAAIWPKAAAWKDALLFIETSEEQPSPSNVKYILRGMAAQGILKTINGILVGKPYDEKYIQEYKEVIMRVVAEEEGLDIPVLYNMNFGHCSPQCILPYGALAEIDCNAVIFRLLEAGIS